jgi:predicted nucleic acid-binding protein
MQLAVDDLFRPKWTTDIHQEWISVLERKRPDIGLVRLEKRRNQMDAKVRDPHVTDYKSLEGTLRLPDENDRHVLAAAIVGNCDVIVTYNLKDFPKAILRKFDLEAQHPDTFLANHLDIFPGKFCAAVQKVRQRHRKKKYSLGEYLDGLTEIELVATVTSLREYASLLDEQSR